MMNIKMKNILELFRTNVGSHLWQMNHEKSDIDINVVYLMDSSDWMLGKRPKGKQIQTEEYDYTYYELEHVINQLLKGNCNYLWTVMSPLIKFEWKNTLRELREIVSTNLAKNCFHSINGLSKHNIYHFIEKGDAYSLKYKKKLNVIGRTLKFGINLLLWGKCMFQKTDIKSLDELYDLKNKLNDCYVKSHLPEKPDPKPFENYLIKWRIKKMKMDGLI